MSRTPLLVGVPLAAALLLLAGCTFTTTHSAPADEIASLAEDALEQQVGARPDIDCGADSIPLVEGSVIDCVLTDPETGDVLDAAVTLSTVEGSHLTVSVKVAADPETPAEPDEPSSDSGSDTVGTLTLTAAEIATTAENALASVDVNGAVACPGSTHQVSAGFALDCTLIQGGDQYTATVTITAVDGNQYSVNVTVPEIGL